MYHKIFKFWIFTSYLHNDYNSSHNYVANILKIKEKIMNNDKTISDNNQEGKLALEGNDATFENKEQIKKILEKQPKQSGANDKSKSSPTNSQKK